MRKPLLLDLFSGAGGAARGYADVGFDVIGVDIAPQKNYPYEFHCADAMDVLNKLLWRGNAQNFSAIHASPPCQEYSTTRHLRNATATAPIIREKLVSQVYTLLRAIGLPYIIENVPGSPMPDALELCGSMFGLPIRRHRWFACSHYLYAPGTCKHADGFVNVVGGKVRGYGTMRSATRTFLEYGKTLRRSEGQYRKEVGQAAMGIDWMTIAEMSEAIPPAYTAWIGRQLMDVIERECEVTG